MLGRKNQSKITPTLARRFLNNNMIVIQKPQNAKFELHTIKEALQKYAEFKRSKFKVKKVEARFERAANG